MRGNFQSYSEVYGNGYADTFPDDIAYAQDPILETTFNAFADQMRHFIWTRPGNDADYDFGPELTATFIETFNENEEILLTALADPEL